MTDETISEFYEMDSNLTGVQKSGEFAREKESYEEPEPKHVSTLFRINGFENICDDDQRQLKIAVNFPFRFVCRLLINDRFGDQYIGTGFFISPRCVVTSGHCVFLRGYWAESIVVIPGDNGPNDRKPFGSQKSSSFRSVKGWTQHGNRDFDYGAIILDNDDLYNRIQGFFEIKVLGNETEVLNFGYSDEPIKRYELWGANGFIQRTTSSRIYYSNDTVGGNSGSPIVVSYYGRYFVVGVHSYGNCPNFCVKITDKVLDVWKNWGKL